jgi:hypothetical protein
MQQNFVEGRTFLNMVSYRTEKTGVTDFREVACV